MLENGVDRVTSGRKSRKPEDTAACASGGAIGDNGSTMQDASAARRRGAIETIALP
jgi:hypothetical protein